MNHIEIDTDNRHQDLLVEHRPHCQSLPVIRPDGRRTINGTFILVGDKKRNLRGAPPDCSADLESLLRITTQRFQAAAASNCRTAGGGSWTPAQQLGNLPIVHGGVIGWLLSHFGPTAAVAASRVLVSHGDSLADMSGIISNGD
jgi:hypothetical protein